jgi:DNA-binding NarL/FixJ family response regulator
MAEDEERVGGPASRPGVADVETKLFVQDLEGRLSQRQKAILHGLMEGHTWRQIGDTLGCTSANVAYHVRGIRQVYTDMVAQQVSGRPLD